MCAQSHDLRMYAIARNDLEMTSGKLASQTGHAFLGAHRRASSELQDQYNNGTKITLSGTLDDIENARKYCEEHNIPHYLMIDEHHIMLPHFTGKPIITALGIGPITKADSTFLKHLSLVK